MSVTMNWKGEQVQSVVLDALKLGIRDVLCDLKMQCDNEVPKDSEDLKKNYSAVLNGEVVVQAECGEVVSCEASDGDIVAVAGYTLPYAARQHEDMALRHPKGGKAKYLEDPFNANTERYIAQLAEAVQRSMP